MSAAAALAHLVALVGAFVWTVRLARFRPPPRGAWLMARALGAAALAGDAWLVVAGVASFPLLLHGVAFILGAGLLLLSFLQGWPNRGLLAVGAVGMAGAFVVTL